MKLFERLVGLTVGDTHITGLDIAFEIEKDLSSEPNPCSVEIFNLSPENRSILSKYDRVWVMLRAGYKDSVGLIFKGDMLSIRHLKEGPTWKTVLASGDGANAIQTARTKKSYAKGTPVKTVVKDLAEQLKLPHDNAIKQIEDLQSKLEKGFMVSGGIMHSMTSILQGKASVSIQDGKLQILKKGEALQKEALVLSSDSGLLSTPEIGSKGEMTLKTVILPELSPGRKVIIRSSVFNGLATIQSVRFSGTNFGENWECEVGVKIG